MSTSSTRTHWDVAGTAQLASVMVGPLCHISTRVCAQGTECSLPSLYVQGCCWIVVCPWNGALCSTLLHSNCLNTPSAVLLPFANDIWCCYLPPPLCCCHEQARQLGCGVSTGWGFRVQAAVQQPRLGCMDKALFALTIARPCNFVFTCRLACLAVACQQDEVQCSTPPRHNCCLRRSHCCSSPQ